MKTSIAYFGTGLAGQIVRDGLKKSKYFDVKVDVENKLKDWGRLKRLLKSKKVEVGVVCSYGVIISKDILEIPLYGFWNIHYSMLPKHRGATPVQSAILAGDYKSGITIIKMNEKLDEGDILAQVEKPIFPDETAMEVIERYSNVAVALINDRLTKFIKGNVKLSEQKGKVSYCYKELMNRKNAKINWAEGADTIYRSIRAFAPDPCAWCLYDGREIKIVRAKTSNRKIRNAKPGKMFKENSKVFLETKDRAIEVLEVSIAGKKRLDAASFANGYLKSPIMLT